MFVLAIGTGVGIFLSQQSAENRSAASDDPNCCWEGWDCGNSQDMWNQGWAACKNHECGGACADTSGGGGSSGGDSGGSSGGTTTPSVSADGNWCITCNCSGSSLQHCADAEAQSIFAGTYPNQNYSSIWRSQASSKCTELCGGSIVTNPTPGGSTPSGGGSTGGTTTPTTSTQNKSAGDTCDPTAQSGLPQYGGCDGSEPLSCIVCPGGTLYAGQNHCSGFTSGAEVAADCGGYVVGNVGVIPDVDVDIINQTSGATCNSSSSSNCPGKNVGSDCIASGNASGYCFPDSINTCTCKPKDITPALLGADTGTCPDNPNGPEWKIYTCNKIDATGGCPAPGESPVSVTTADGTQSPSLSPAVCQMQQADCVMTSGSGLVFRTAINADASCYGIPVTPTTIDQTYSCNSPCTSTPDCQTANTEYTCYSSGTCRHSSYPDEADCQPPQTTPPSTPPPTIPPVAEEFICSSLTPSIPTPDLGQTVNFTCAAAGTGVSQVNRYDFQYRIDSGAWQQIGVSTANINQSLSLVITEPGSYRVQCRACSTDKCTPWDTL